MAALPGSSRPFEERWCGVKEGRGVRRENGKGGRGEEEGKKNEKRKTLGVHSVSGRKGKCY
jgi:hypothetical protein